MEKERNKQWLVPTRKRHLNRISAAWVRATLANTQMKEFSPIDSDYVWSFYNAMTVSVRRNLSQEICQSNVEPKTSHSLAPVPDCVLFPRFLRGCTRETISCFPPRRITPWLNDGEYQTIFSMSNPPTRPGQALKWTVRTRRTPSPWRPAPPRPWSCRSSLYAGCSFHDPCPSWIPRNPPRHS